MKNFALSWTCRLLVAMIASPIIAAWAEPSVELFSPQGVVKGVRQVTARFSTQMVAFGDLRLESPFDVECPEKGTGRWVDGKNWSFDFEHDLPAGINCEFKLKSNLKDVAGTAIGGEKAFTFSTGGPAIIRSLPYEGSEQIDENQVFILGLDAPATESSIKKNAYCQVEGLSEKIPVNLVEGKQREELLAIRRDFIDGFGSIYFRRQGLLWRTDFAIKDKSIEQLPIVLLQCKRTLVARGRMNLVWAAGIISRSGVSAAEDQTLSYRVRPEFAAEFSCQRVNSKAHCISFLPMSVSFSAPIRKQDANAIVLKGNDGTVYTSTIDENEKSDFIEGVTFKGPFPESASFAVELPKNLRDDAGRELANQASFPLQVATDEMPPLAKFAAPFGIIELKGDGLLPVTLRNLEAQIPTRIAAVSTQSLNGKTFRVVGSDDEDILNWLSRINAENSEDWRNPGATSLFTDKDKLDNFELPKPNGAKPFEVVGIPLKKPGFYVVELQSPILGAALTRNKTPMFVRSSALVTNMAVHFKHGSESSLVWVTTLDKAQPVADAAIAVRNCSGNLLWSGKTNAQGLAKIERTLSAGNCYRPAEFFISARSGDDMSFTLSNWDGGIQPWRFNLPTQLSRYRDNALVHTVFDRTLLMAGDTVHMKHFARQHHETRMGLPNFSNLTNKLIIRHVGSDQTYEVALAWNKNGQAENEWKIPEAAKQGVYNVEIGNKQAGSFRVEAFRLPTMKAILKTPSAPAIAAKSVDLDVQLNYLAGGVAAYTPVKLRSAIENKTVSFPDYADFEFSNGAIKKGNSAEPVFDSDEGEFVDEADSDANKPSTIRTQTTVLDEHGATRIAIDKLPLVDTPSNLRAELEYRDANGETLSSSTQIPLWPSQYVIGIKPDGWAMTKDHSKFQTVVLDTRGKPVVNADVSVEFLQRNYLSHRRRLIGGFYAYENSSEVKKLGVACSGKTDAKGLLFCDVSAPATGNLILQAKVTDTAGRAAIAHRDTWVAGSDDWWFAASDNDRIDVLPEKKRYEVGDTATLQVRMPFREATVLITVEREGILDTYVQSLSGKAPVVHVPIKNNYAPNMYVSVFVVRGRVTDFQPTALVDLGKPAYKMGIAELQVGWKPHELKVAVTTDKNVYKIRDKVKVKVHVQRADGKALPAGSEIALAAVDEALLELMPNDSWKLLDAMMQRRSLEVETSTAQMEVIGKRHFGRKAVPSGGGGGKAPARELLDAILYWKGTIVLDANGEANIEVPLNDALTSFRFVAIATGDADLFGTGETSLRSTQDLILVSGLPSLVREGDRFRAGFTVRNTSNQPFAVTASAKFGVKNNRNPQDANASTKILEQQTFAVPAGQAHEFGWSVEVPNDTNILQWEIGARDNTAGAQDRMRLQQKVSPVVPVRTLQATLLQVDQPVAMTVKAPADALTGRGGVRTLLVDKLGKDLPGVREYMSQYPYDCFEQQTSQAIALHDKAHWQALMGALPTYLDNDGLIKYFPTMLLGSDTLTAYVVAIADEAGYEIPEPQLLRMRKALSNFVQGKIVRGSALPTADLAIRKIAALEALSRSDSMRPDMLDSIQIEPNLWPTSAVIDWRNILQRSANIPQRGESLQTADHILRSRLNLQGTTMGFSTERNDVLWWLMISGDVNANRFILSMLDNDAWKSDMGRLVRAALGRQYKGHWNTTVANAWGTLAIEKFSKKFEAETVSGATQIDLAGQRAAIDWSKNPEGDAVLESWPQSAAELSIKHNGTGKPWATVQSLAAIPLKAPLSSGYKIIKTVTPIEQKQNGAWSVGDVYRVHLDLEAQADMTWVVVDDPIPASASVLGNGLGRDSKLLTNGQKNKGWAYPAFEERTLQAFRSYFEFVPKGKWSVEYTVRLNNAGEFQLPPTRVEAMYSPEMFGEIPNAAISIAQ